MKMLLRTLSAALLIGAVFTQSGCLLAVAAVGTGATVAYVKGDADITFKASPDAVASAAEAAMKELSVSVISNESSKLDAKVVGRTARDTKLTVVAKSGGGELSTVSVRAGMFGDSQLQNQLIEKMRARLEQPAAPVADSAKPVSPSTQPAVADVR